jgi:hypothetical protein
MRDQKRQLQQAGPIHKPTHASRMDVRGDDEEGELISVIKLDSDDESNAWYETQVRKERGDRTETYKLAASTGTTQMTVSGGPIDAVNPRDVDPVPAAWQQLRPELHRATYQDIKTEVVDPAIHEFMYTTKRRKLNGSAATAGNYVRDPAFCMPSAPPAAFSVDALLAWVKSGFTTHAATPSSFSILSPDDLPLHPSIHPGRRIHYHLQGPPLSACTRSQRSDTTEQPSEPRPAKKMDLSVQESASRDVQIARRGNG